MTGVHNVLDVAGLIPGVGEIADGLNAAIYILEGDKANAAFSAAAMIPFAGWGATGVKFAKKLDSGIRQASATGTQRTPYDNFGEMGNLEEYLYEGAAISRQKAIEVTKGTGNAFDVAKSGGKHSGLYKQYVGKSDEEIRKAIQSLDKQIAEHQDKIRNPEKYIPNFRDLDPRQQEALLNKKWPSDIQRQLEQKEILEGILRSR